MRADLPRLERHVYVRVLDQSERPEANRLERYLSVFYWTKNVKYSTLTDETIVKEFFIDLTTVKLNPVVKIIKNVNL